MKLRTTLSVHVPLLCAIMIMVCPSVSTAAIKHDCITVPSNLEDIIHSHPDHENGGRSCTINSRDIDSYTCNHESLDAQGRTLWEAHVDCDALQCEANGQINCSGTKKPVTNFLCPVGKMTTSITVFWCDSNGNPGLQEGWSTYTPPGGSQQVYPPDMFANCATQ